MMSTALPSGFYLERGSIFDRWPHPLLVPPCFLAFPSQNTTKQATFCLSRSISVGTLRVAVITLWCVIFCVIVWGTHGEAKRNGDIQAEVG